MLHAFIPAMMAAALLPKFFTDGDEKQWNPYARNLPYQNIWRHWLDEGTGKAG